MLIHAAVCPHPPLLVPELAGEAAPELDGLRAACARAVSRLADAVAAAAGAGADAEIVVVGGARRTRRFGARAVASLRPYGLITPILNGESESGISDTGGRSDPCFGQHEIGAVSDEDGAASGTGPGEASGAEVLPLSLTIGRWLLRDVLEGLPDGVPVGFQAVADDASPEECLRLGRELAGPADRRVALLVMGDGSACLNEKAPGYLDPRAEPYDAAVAEALRTADASALAALDPALSRELWVAGRAAWQVLAGAAGTAGAGSPDADTADAGTVGGGAGGGAPLDAARSDAAGSGAAGSGAARFDAELLAYEAPYGVGYLVATWDGRPRP